MTTQQPLPDLLTPGASLHRFADGPATRFTGVVARETVDRYQIPEALPARVRALLAELQPTHARP